MSTNKQNQTNNNPYQSWQISSKQKQLEDKSISYNQSSSSKDRQANKPSQNKNNNNNNNNQKKSRKKRGYQDQTNVVYVRKYPIQPVTQNCDISKSSTNQNQLQKDQQNQNAQENQKKFKNNRPHQANLYEPTNKNPKTEQEQTRDMNNQAQQNYKQKVLGYYNEWNSDPKNYLSQQFYNNEDKCYDQTNQIYGGKKEQIQKVLLVAEKPSIARKIASALSDKKFQKQKGKNVLPVYVFEKKFKGLKTLFKVTSVVGHVYKQDFSQNLKNWNEINPVRLFSLNTQKIPIKRDIVKHLQYEAKNCSYLLLWLDNDREGENICFEVKQICERVMYGLGDNVQQILRSRFSSLTKQDIIQSFRLTTDPPDINKSKSVDARRIIDLKIGVAFTRYQTLFFRNKYPNLSKEIVSFGPCQTPTLAFCVEREDQIKKFIPSLIFKVKLTFLGSDSKTEILAYCDQKDITSEDKAKEIFEQIKTEQKIQIISVTSEKQVKEGPVGLNAVEMLKYASNTLKMSPQQTTEIAQNLYQQGFITYPRTESTAYSENFDFQRILKALQQDKDYGKFAQDLIKKGYQIPTKGLDMEDHPPITPTQNYPRPENVDLLTKQERELYDYISKHFIASLCDDYKYDKLKIKCQVKGLQFISDAIKVVSQGYTQVFESAEHDQNIIQINIKEDSKLQIKNISIEKDYTTSPNYLSESELIDLMEKNSIGTDASIPKHIKNIVDRKYVEINEENRTLRPTKLGRALIDGFKKIDKELVTPQIRAQIENSVNQIATSEKKFSQVINESLALFQNKYVNFVQNIQNMDNLFQLFCKTFQQELQKAKPLSKCGLCNNIMKLIEESEQVVCESCDLKLYLPQSGNLQISEERFCQIDNFQMIQYTSSNQNKDLIDICPKCYTASFYKKHKKYQI
ncbi:hypothetical protein ABPG74_022062 [Tetrahymena malaccensis]